MAEYVNPWHDPRRPNYGPVYFKTDAKTHEYAGCQIYKVSSIQFDVVKNGICLTQVGSMKVAQKYIDIFNGPRPTDNSYWYDRMHQYHNDFRELALKLQVRFP